MTISEHQLTEIRATLDVVANILSGLYARLDTIVDANKAKSLAVPHSEYTNFYVRHKDAVTPDVPEGYDTILGFLAKRHPDVLDTFDYRDATLTVRDGFKLAHMDNKLGTPVYVEAPSCLRAAGIERVRAYPVALLQQRWG